MDINVYFVQRSTTLISSIVKVAVLRKHGRQSKYRSVNSILDRIDSRDWSHRHVNT